jgi:RHH-type proline utilization regulon transcriptional repressor/proline dehydrogenase/delta 1-pyrroline-5-carboxylate dehydrogenase
MGESFDYAGLPTRVYAPVGAPDDLLAYLVRRLLENGANSSFLKRLADNKAELLDVDVLATPADDVAVIPASPRDVYAGKRLSAKGVDFEHPSFPLEFATTPTYDPSSRGTKAVVVDGSVESEAKLEALFARMRSFSPAANAPRVGGSVSETTTTDNPVLKRAGILRAAADIIERESVSITKLIMTEAGKTTADAVAELRECVDFFRFYADRAAETLAAPKTLPTVTGESCLMQAQPRGPWLCIGPFNFPFAIVGGLASSAYVAGNPVVIKPHPATRRCALALADVLHRAGMPEGEVAVVCDDVNPDASTAIVETGASDAGARLVGSGVFSGVSFVGGTRTAAKINHALATVALERPGAPLARFVAETGGLNVLVADASALPEQVSDAVIASFAAAAGQRCSSARILVLDEGCKDAVVGMLAGGLKALRVSSDTLDVSTDVGPLISASAKAKATAQCAALEANGATLLCATTDDLAAADADAANPRLFHPRAYELPNGEDGLDLLIDETFAPVLHVVTYDGSAESLKRVIDRVNAKGFALTGGVLTRCDSTKALVASTLDCGNFYVNRDVVGAVVESQPFGGHGLSGNGVKAGSEGYLEQFVSHKVVCEDTTASGGNVELLRGGGD